MGLQLGRRIFLGQSHHRLRMYVSVLIHFMSLKVHIRALVHVEVHTVGKQHSSQERKRSASFSATPRRWPASRPTAIMSARI
jgi:hypothetical protein